MTGITPHFYGYIESGERNPSIETAKRIAKVLGFNWTMFFEDENEKNDKEEAAHHVS